MKLFNSIGPNPHVVRMFIAEKGLDIPREDIDLVAGENRKPEHMKRNPSGQCPVLELDDGSCLSEITAICEYLEEKHPTPVLIGATPEERAKTRMWTRKIDLNILEPMTGGFRYGEGLKLFQNRIRCLPEASAGLKAIAQDNLKWLDAQLADKEFICGDRFSLADVMSYCFLAFAATARQPLNPDFKHLGAWFERVSKRPSAAA